jgi:hypothetical protein
MRNAQEGKPPEWIEKLLPYKMPAAGAAGTTNLAANASSTRAAKDAPPKPAPSVN